MKIINLERGQGKTTMLIKLSATHNTPIICSSFASKSYILNKAREMGLTIPEPINVRNCDMPYILRGLNINSNCGVLVDDLECVLQYFLGEQVSVATTSCEVINLEGK